MSLEQQVAALTVAVDNLTAAFNGAARGIGADQPAPAKTTAPEKAAPGKVAKGTKAAPAAKAEDDEPEADKPAAIDFEEVRAITRELGVKVNRDAVVDLLAKFKVAKASELKQEKYGAFIKEAKAKIEAGKDALEPEEDEDLAG